MNINLLIDAIVQQTTILIAQLATAAGSRAPLADTANQVFMALVRELKEQGLGNTVIADMFGLSLRTYHNKTKRLSESNTERGRTLWEAVLQYVQERGTVLRVDVLKRFCRDDEATVRGVLKDLADSGVLFQSGKGDSRAYRAPAPDEYPEIQGLDTESQAAMVWVAVNRYGPASAQQLQDVLRLDLETLSRALDTLMNDNRIRTVSSENGCRYTCDHCFIPMDASFGWEAAVFDHYQAMVTAIGTKLRTGIRRAIPGEAIGGSTYSYRVWQGHPLLQEVLGFLQNTRERAVDLRKRVEAHNAQSQPPDTSQMRVFTYVGQTVIQQEEEEEAE